MAISPMSYAVGNRVYRGGSSAPTMGTVDPEGYVDRSLNAPSDRRSGLAAAALRRLGGSNGAQSRQLSPAGMANAAQTVPVPDLSSILSGNNDPAMSSIPTVRDAVRARMAPDGTYRLNVRQLQDQVAHAHDYSSAAQRALAAMTPLPSVQAMNGTSNG